MENAISLLHSAKEVRSRVVRGLSIGIGITAISIILASVGFITTEAEFPAKAFRWGYIVFAI